MEINQPLNRTTKFLYNTFFSAVHQVVILIAGFIIPRIMLQYYGSEINGLITSITQFISYFNLVEAGLANASIFALYKPLSENNYKEISAIVVATQKSYITSGYIFFLLIGILAFIYPLNIHVSGINYFHMFLLIIVLGFSGIVDFFTLGKYKALLNADQKLYVISISSILYTILNTIILAAMAKIRINIVIVKIVSISSILLRCFILYTYSKQNYPYINYKEVPNSKALNKRWDALSLQILDAIRNGAPIVITTFFLGLKEVSIYSIYNMIIGGISGILGIFTSGLSSSFGDVIVKKQIDILQKAYQEFEFVYYSISSVAYSVSFIMLMPFIQIYTYGITDIDYYNPFLGGLFVLNAILQSIKIPQIMLVIAAGHYRETKYQAIIQGVIVIVGSVILVQIFGLVGILLGLFCSDLYRTISLVLYAPKKITGLSVFATIKRVICTIMEMVIIIWPCHHLKIVCNTYMQWIIYATAITMYAITVTLIIGGICNRKEFIRTFKRIKNICKKTI